MSNTLIQSEPIHHYFKCKIHLYGTYHSMCKYKEELSSCSFTFTLVPSGTKSLKQIKKNNKSTLNWLKLWLKHCTCRYSIMLLIKEMFGKFNSLLWKEIEVLSSKFQDWWRRWWTQILKRGQIVNLNNKPICKWCYIWNIQDRHYLFLSKDWMKIKLWIWRTIWSWNQWTPVSVAKVVEIMFF